MCIDMPDMLYNRSIKFHLKEFNRNIEFLYNAVRTVTSKPEEDKLLGCGVKQPVRKNVLNIQMLTENLYTQIFKQQTSKLPEIRENDTKKIKKHLEKFDLWNKQTTALPDVDLKLPEIEGINIDCIFAVVFHCNILF